MIPDREPVSLPPRTPTGPARTPTTGHESSRTRSVARIASASVAGILALALILGACGSSTPTPTPGETPGPGQSLAPGETADPGDSSAPLETAEPGESTGPGESSAPPEITPTPGIIVGPGETPADTPPPGYEEETPPPHPTAKPKPTPTLTPNAALEKKLPNAIRGVKLVKDSYSGKNMPPASDPRTIPTRELLKNLNAKAANLSVATAADPTGKLALFLNAIRVAKVPTEALFTNYLAVLEKYSQRGIEKGTATLGGKKVTTVVDIDQRDAGSKTVMYMYAKGDIIYVVYTDDKALAANALKAMP